MKQTQLPTSSRTLLVDTFPNTRVHKNPNNLINIGMEYAAKALDADVVHWKETIDVSKYEVIGFNVSYLTYVLNIAPFLRRNNIEVFKTQRKSHQIIAGGPGAANINKALGEIVDHTFLGEIDGTFKDSKGFFRCKGLTSPAVLKGNGAVVEIARGCKHKCSFCEYGHILGGPYREKELALVKEQITTCLKSTRSISLRTANLASYSNLEELASFCNQNKVSLRWGDIAILDAENIIPHLKSLKLYSPKIGIESFDQATRKNIGKPFDDDYLEETLREIFQHCSSIHIFLIYGLPGDNYDSWFTWAKRLAKLRNSFPHPIRIDFSITSFEPCPNTPLSAAQLIDFTKREEFLKTWIRVMKEEGFYKESWEIKPGNDFGRFGRKQLTYQLIQEIRTAGPRVGQKIAEALPWGIERSPTDKIAKMFLDY